MRLSLGRRLGSATSQLRRTRRRELNALTRVFSRAPLRERTHDTRRGLEELGSVHQEAGHSLLSEPRKLVDWIPKRAESGVLPSRTHSQGLQLRTPRPFGVHCLLGNSRWLFLELRGSQRRSHVGNRHDLCRADSVPAEEAPFAQRRCYSTVEPARATAIILAWE